MSKDSSPTLNPTRPCSSKCGRAPADLPRSPSSHDVTRGRLHTAFIPEDLLENPMVLEPIRCPTCDGINVNKHGKTENGKQRFICKDNDCECCTFILDYSEKGRLPETKRKIVDMALNGSGVRDTARVLSISTATVINELKKRKRVAAR